MTKILDLGSNPVLGRVHAVNRKHRLRSKHYAEVEDWPMSGATVDVIDADALDAMDHYPCRDEMFIVSEKLLEVLRTVDDAIESHELDAGGRTVYLVMPLAERDVPYESDGYPRYSKNGYSVLDGKDLRASEAPKQAFCNVRNTGLIALRDDVVTAAEEAGIRWNVTDLIESYAPFRPHPYHVYRTGYAVAVADVIEAASDWPEAPADLPHPLGPNVRDENFDGDPHRAWSKRAQQTNSLDDAAFVRYCSGLELPKFTASLAEDVAKSKIKKRWKETLAAGCLQFERLPCVSAGVRDRMLAAGVEARFDPVPLHDPRGGESTAFYLVHPEHVVDWIDWSGSDVGLLWSGLHDEYFDLEPTEESYESTIPLVRVAGSNLILVHESLASQLTDEEGFYMTPLSDCAVARNLDGGFNAT